MDRGGEKVKKLVLSALALFALSIMIVAPVKAITKEPYWEHVEGSVTGYPDKEWLANGILHIEGLPFAGSYVGTLGTGTMEVCMEHITVNTETEMGTCLATWTVIIGENTLSGSANGKIVGGLSGTSEGYFRGTQGTGEFEGIVKWGTYSLNFATGVLEAEGVIIYH
jgi:hypothetical protein